MDFAYVDTYRGETANGLQSWVDRTVGEGGYRSARVDPSNPRHRRVMEAARLYADVVTGREDSYFIKQAMQPSNEMAMSYLVEKYPGLYPNLRGRQVGLRETMSVTDYQALFVDVLDRMYYGYYNEYPISNKSLVRSHSLRDFRTVSRYLLDGVVTPLTATDAAAPAPQRALQPPVPQDGATYALGTNAPPLQYAPKLYNAMTSVNWRAFVNDDLGIVQDLAKRLAIAGNRGIAKFITGFYVDANGPNALLYTSGYKNIINQANGAASNNPALSTQGIMDAMKILAGMRDSGGDPILITGRLKLWYGPAYAATVNNVMNALSVYVQNEGGISNTQGFPVQFVQVTPWMVQQVDPVLDPYIPIVASSSNGTTSWGIMVDPQAQARPAIEVGWLNGYEVPQIYTKVPNTARMGGGVDATLGDFYTMDQDMKIITVMGGTQIDGRSTVASNGSGS